jgi:hypothetical protein
MAAMAARVAPREPQFAADLLERSLPHLSGYDTQAFAPAIYAIARVDLPRAEAIVGMIPLDQSDITWAVAASGLAAALQPTRPLDAARLVEQIAAAHERAAKQSNYGMFADALPFLASVDMDTTMRLLALLPDDTEDGVRGRLEVTRRIVEQMLRQQGVWLDPVDW